MDDTAHPQPQTAAAGKAKSKGERTRERLFEIAVRRFETDGFEKTSLRSIAGDAGVTPALLYRYFANKDAIVAELYGRSLKDWHERADAIPNGTWIERAHWLTTTAFEVLAPHRTLLRALVPSMLNGDATASPLRNPHSMQLGQPVFIAAVSGAKDAPKAKDTAAYVELANLGHLTLLLFWVLDKSPEQRATQSLMRQSLSLGPWLKLGLKTPVVGKGILALVHTVTDALRLGDDQ